MPNWSLFSFIWSQNHKPYRSKEEGKIAGPIFLFIGLLLELLGMTVAFVGYKLNKEMKRQKKIQQLCLSTDGRTPQINEYSFNKFDDLPGSNGSREISVSGEISGQGYDLDRRRTLPTIAHVCSQRKSN